MPIINSTIQDSSIDIGNGKYVLTIVDYDGELIKRVHLDKGTSYTLPAGPTKHSKLTFASWACNETITNGAITMPNRNVTVFATYTPTSGKDEFDINILFDGQSITFHAPQDCAIDWGDGSTGTGLGASDIAHTYTYKGSYTISVTPTQGLTYDRFMNAASNYPDYSCTEIRLTGDMTTSGLTFMGALKSITCPSTKGGLTGCLVTGCRSLKVLPLISTTSATAYGSNYATSLKYVMIPPSITTITAISYSNVPEVFFPPAVSTFSATSGLGTNIQMSSLVPADVYDFSQHYTIPTIAQSTFVANYKFKLRVPSVLLSSWKSATNWSGLADNIVPAEDETKVTVTVNDTAGVGAVTVGLGSDIESALQQTVKTYHASDFTNNTLEIGLPLGAVARVHVVAATGYTASSPNYVLMNPVGFTDGTLDVTLTAG